MITFICSIVLLIGGYFIYGTFVEKQFGADGNRKTPAYESEDGVDYVPMSWSKIFLIQFLNIAGLGPIFGAVLGAVYGPSAFIWIVLGSILSFCKQYLNYVDNYGKEIDERNILSPISNLPYSDILILSECRLYDGVDLEVTHRISRVYRFFLGISKFIRTYSTDGCSELFWSSGTPGGELFLRERFLRIISEKIVYFWNFYDYHRLVDFYQTLEDSNDKDLVDFEIRNYSFRYNRIDFGKKAEPDYQKLPLVRRLAAAALIKCRDKVKHKRLNDLSGIYSYHE